MSRDPFHFHPELRAKIKPFAESFFRNLTTSSIKQVVAENGYENDFPFHCDATREALRTEALAGHDGDLWVFGYGSLIWDPALDFAEVRRTHAPEHARRFILVDVYGGRGTRDAPGLMAALDIGGGCDGVAFRIAAEKVEEETRILFQRELIGPGYLARFIPLRIGDETVRALSFLADHSDPIMAPDIDFDTQVAYAATGSGFLGSSLEYLSNVVSHLHDMNIPDPELDALLHAARTKAGEIADARSARPQT